MTALGDADLDPDPFAQFRRWFAEAAGEDRPDAMALATASTEGAPSVRMVLLKGSPEGGFEFFTNRESRKGRELTANPRAAIAFHWPKLHRQVRVEGAVHELSEEASNAYFATRPRGAQLASHASRQSTPLASRAALEAAWDEAAAAYPHDVPRPDRWGGYRLVPDVIEFWQGRDDRLHDRFVYSRVPGRDAWSIERLSP
jgi:pyridoxamine 5'-phosphate oxidase